jgi:hypothetical protein
MHCVRVALQTLCDAIEKDNALVLVEQPSAAGLRSRSSAVHFERLDNGERAFIERHVASLGA